MRQVWLTQVCLTDFREGGAPLGPEAKSMKFSILCIVMPSTWDLVSDCLDSSTSAVHGFLVL